MDQVQREGVEELNKKINSLTIMEIYKTLNYYIHNQTNFSVLES